MRSRRLLTGVCVAMTMVLGCAQTKYQIVVGESFASSAEAAREAENAVNAASRYGYRPISVGGAGAGAAVKDGGGLILNCYVLLEGPSTAPDVSEVGVP